MAGEKFNYSSDFQSAILACKVRYPEKFLRFKTIFQPRFFNGLPAIETAFAIVEFEKQYNQTPTFSSLANFVFQRHYKSNPERATETFEFVRKLAALDVKNADYVVDSVRDFARERAVQDAVTKVIISQQEGKELVGGIVKLFEEAVKVGNDTLNIGLSLRDDIDLVIDKLTHSEYGVKTGFVLLDQIWRTGWAPGWLIVPLAPPKSFKTAFCLNLAINIASPPTSGTVFYYACEISDDLAMFRSLCNISKQSKDELYVNPEVFREICHSAIHTTIDGDILFKHFPAGTATIGDIKAHAKMVAHEAGVTPKAIVVDYAETILPSVTKNKEISDWRAQASIYTEAKAMGEELGCPVIMPDRCNKEAVEMEVPLATSFQGGYQKAGIVDLAIALCASPAELLHNTMRYFILLNRHGPQFLHFKGKVDPEIMRMSIDEKLEYDPEAAKVAVKKWKSKGQELRTKKSMPPELLDNENA